MPILSLKPKVALRAAAEPKTISTAVTMGLRCLALGPRSLSVAVMGAWPPLAAAATAWSAAFWMASFNLHGTEECFVVLASAEVSYFHKPWSACGLHEDVAQACEMQSSWCCTLCLSNECGSALPRHCTEYHPNNLGCSVPFRKHPQPGLGNNILPYEALLYCCDAVAEAKMTTVRVAIRLHEGAVHAFAGTTSSSVAALQGRQAVTQCWTYWHSPIIHTDTGAGSISASALGVAADAMLSPRSGCGHWLTCQRGVYAGGLAVHRGLG